MADSPASGPIFIVSPPSPLASALARVLAAHPDVAVIPTGQSNVLEQIDALSPQQRQWDSNRLTADDLTDDIATQARDLMEQAAGIDASGATASESQRLLDATPKNALRIPFLAALYPDATFVYLYPDAISTVAAMRAAWLSGDAVTYPDLPEWWGEKWSMLLVPGWRELIGKPIAQVVAQQWAIATDTAVADLQALPADRWAVVHGVALAEQPQREIDRLLEFLGLQMTDELAALMPAPTAAPKGSRTVDPELAVALAQVSATAQRALDLFGEAPEVDAVAGDSARAASNESMVPGEQAVSASVRSRFASVSTNSFADLLRQAEATVIVSTYKSGHVIFIRADENGLNTHFRSFPRPMGMAVSPRGHLSIGTADEVVTFINQPLLAQRLDPPNRNDVVFVPRWRVATGDIQIHDMAYGHQGLWAVNTRFSCLSRIEPEVSFAPAWRPKWITGLAAEDRCHLNGLAMIDNKPTYVTALSQTNEPMGWRAHKGSSGVVVHVESDEVVSGNLSMPHSPRWHNGNLYVLESGKGALSRVDLASGRTESIIELPGFTRGLAFIGRYALVGLSQVRETVFSGLPLTERKDERACGVWIIDLETATVAGYLKFTGVVQELFEVAVIRGRWPELIEFGAPAAQSAFILPDGVLGEVENRAPSAG